MATIERERSLAVFIDFENLALGFQNQRDRFDIQKVLERLVEKGKIVVKKAYADWSRFAGLHRAAARGGHRADRDPHARARPARTRPTSACASTPWTWPIQGPHRHLRHRLRRQRLLAAGLQAEGELGKHVIGLGMQDSTSDLLRDNCDEFIYYEDLEPGAARPAAGAELDADLPETQAQGVRAAARVAAGPAAREQGSPLVVDDQGHDEAQEAVVQRDVLRLPHLQRAARRRRQPRRWSTSSATRAAGPTWSSGSASARPPSTPRKARRPRARVAWSGSTRLGRGIASRRPRSLDAARKPGVSGPPTDGRPMVDHLPRCRGPERISRREMLQVGGAGLLGLSLPGLLRAEAERGRGAPGSRRGPTPASSSSSTAGRATSTCGT